jgi:hypothetical protein
MRTPRIFHVFTALMMISVSLFSFVSVAEARGYAAVGTLLTIETPASVSVGSPSIVLIHLASIKGKPIDNQRVELFIDGVHARTARTNPAGNISLRILKESVGTYKLYAIFKGSRLPSLGSSSADAELVIKPATIEIHTTPALPNIRFSLDNQVFSSDAYGVARIEVQRVGKYHLALLPLQTQDPNIQMQFGRWGDEIFKTSRDIEVPLDKPLEIGFEVSYQVSQTFLDLSGRPVDPSRVASITLKGSNGTTYTFDDNKPHWLPSGRVVRLNDGLEETKILYSVISVVIDGSNVVSQAQQRFYVNSGDVWPVKLLLYKANFTARDALFGFPIGSGVHVEYPNGNFQSYSFDTGKGYAIDGLARGIYRVKVIGAKGYAPATPIALSRDQDVELMVFSYLDIAVLSVLGLLLSLGLLLFGRPYLLTPVAAVGRWFMPKSQPVVQARSTNKFTALVARLFPKRKTAELEDAGVLAEPGEIAGSSIVQQTQEENALPQAILDAAQDLLMDSGNGQNQQTSEVESLA